MTLRGTQLAVPDSPTVPLLSHTYCANSNAQKVPSYFCIMDRMCVNTITFPRLLSRYTSHRPAAITVRRLVSVVVSPEASSVPTHSANRSNAGRRSPSPFVFVSTESSDAVTSQKCTCPIVFFPSQSPSTVLPLTPNPFRYSVTTIASCSSLRCRVTTLSTSRTSSSDLTGFRRISCCCPASNEKRPSSRRSSTAGSSAT